jgi:arylsulfatase A-like enzyme
VSMKKLLIVSALALCLWGCSRGGDELESMALPESERPAILLVTLDTTRADRLGIESNSVGTPNFRALADRGLYFNQAYSTTPTTLPSHTSMFTGLYPDGHGIRENGRRAGGELDLLAPKMKRLGYGTAAFVSGFPLASQFGLARGFDVFDDAFAASANERTADKTIDAVVQYLEQDRAADFVWVRHSRSDSRGDPARSSWLATTAKGSVSTVRCSTATCSIREPCAFL